MTVIKTYGSDQERPQENPDDDQELQENRGTGGGIGGGGDHPNIAAHRLALALLFIVMLVAYGSPAIYFYCTASTENTFSQTGNGTSRVIDAAYFSVVTMQTVGYGDIVPHSDRAKMVMSAVVFIVAGIVGSFFSRIITHFIDQEQEPLISSFIQIPKESQPVPGGPTSCMLQIDVVISSRKAKQQLGKSGY